MEEFHSAMEAIHLWVSLRLPQSISMVQVKEFRANSGTIGEGASTGLQIHNTFSVFSKACYSFLYGGVLDCPCEVSERTGPCKSIFLAFEYFSYSEDGFDFKKLL